MEHAGEGSARLKEIQNLMEDLGREDPKEMGAYGQFIQSVLRGSHISVKEKELIAVALSISSQCEWCIPYHTKMALNAGATREEIIDAGMVAVLMNGSPALMHMIPLINAIDEFSHSR
jgi:AhpD family alkylhydroperoxidase